MSHAFQKLYTLINTLLNWSNDNSFLEDVLFQMMDAIEDIENVYQEKEKKIQELEEKLAEEKWEHSVTRGEVSRLKGKIKNSRYT